MFACCAQALKDCVGPDKDIPGPEISALQAPGLATGLVTRLRTFFPAGLGPGDAA